MCLNRRLSRLRVAHPPVRAASLARLPQRPARIRLAAAPQLPAMARLLRLLRPVAPARARRRPSPGKKPAARPKQAPERPALRADASRYSAKMSDRFVGTFEGWNPSTSLRAGCLNVQHAIVCG